LPPTRDRDHHIPLLVGSGPVNVRPYRYPHYQKNEIERLIVGLLQNGVIRTSSSSYSSPILLVKKHDGSWRLYVYYRALNRLTVWGPILFKIGPSLRLSSNSHDVEKIAFRTHHGHFEFLVMPFGLTNAPSTFQALMN